MILASRPHYADHLAPIADLVDIPDEVALVASHHDVVQARKRGARRIILGQHGAGQSFGGDPRTDYASSYPGGADHDDVGLFLVPNEHAANRWRDRYPKATVRVVGCPALDTRPHKDPAEPFTVALSFHWNATFSPEAKSALAWHKAGLPELARRFHVIGHGHPRRNDLPGVYRRLGIEHVPDLGETFRRADVLVADHMSILYEFAATRRPVVALNAPWYRRDVHHGLRFWDAIPGPQADHPNDLPDALLEAMTEGPERREAALSKVYAYRTGAAHRAADAITEWLA